MLILSLDAAALAQGAATAPPSPPRDAQQLFNVFTAETFRSLPAAAEKIDLEQIDDDLLSAAVFHETNKRRKQHGLPALAHEPKLRHAAEMQAEIMAARGAISHDNPEIIGKETTAARLRLAGLNIGFAAENVATAFGVSYKKGEQVYPREENGKKFLSREPAGEAIPPHTYVTFAEALLDDLMASPLHRGSIVSPKPAFLAVGCRLKVNELGMPLFYCAQEFYTPPREAPKTRERP